MKKLTINMNWHEAIGFIGAICGLLSFILGMLIFMWMSEINKATDGEILLFVLFAAGLIVSMVGPGVMLRSAAAQLIEGEKQKEEDEKIEREFEPQLAGCIEMEYCPDENPATNCASFGTTHCPLEKERGDI